MKRLQENRMALGSHTLLTLVLEDEADEQVIYSKLWQLIDDFEARFSRFLPDSETSRFNNRAGHYMSLSPEFMDLLSTCQDLAKETDGLFNPFILPNLQREGYIGSWPTPSSYKGSVDYRGRWGLPAIDKLKINGNKARIPINSALDFGGIGKGYLLDQLASYLDSQKLTRYWLSIGGDIVCNGLDIDNQAWFVKIAHATKADELVGVINNEGSKLAIATSGVTKRKGQSWHHIIDPRTGKSAETDVLTATVVGDKATKADVYAKCLVVLGLNAAETFLSNRQVKTSYIQTDSGKVYCVGKGVKAL